MSLNPGCGRRRFASRFAAEKAVGRGAEGSLEECRRGGLVHWHLAAPADGPYIPAVVRGLVLARDGWCCVDCGQNIARQRYSLGHRWRSGQGGPASPENLITLLGLGGEKCHGRVDLFRDPQDAARGYRLTSRQNPAEVPVLYATPDGPAWFLLLPDGGRLAVPAPERADAA